MNYESNQGTNNSLFFSAKEIVGIAIQALTGWTGSIQEGGLKHLLIIMAVGHYNP
jgi:hypothetical protein